MASRHTLLTRVIVRGLKLYKSIISPLLPPSCRFYPTCSEYACQAFILYGTKRGGWKSICRLARCHPFHLGGHDPLI